MWIKFIFLYSVQLRKSKFFVIRMPSNELIIFIIVPRNVYFILRNSDELFLKNNGIENCFHKV